MFEICYVDPGELSHLYHVSYGCSVVARPVGSGVEYVIVLMVGCVM